MNDTKIKLNDYVVIDIENPNCKADSICQMGIIQVKDNKVVYKRNVLINPEDRFDDINIRIHKITPNMVKDSITFNIFWDEVKEIITNNIIIGHGIKYDISVIAKSLKKYGISIPCLKIICTQNLSKKYLNIKKYGLDYVCDTLQINLERHHNALYDAEASQNIFEYIKDNYGIAETDIEEYTYYTNPNDQNENHSNHIKVVYSNETKSLQILKSIIEEIMLDSVISEKEMHILRSWLNNNKQLVGNYPFDKINDVVNKVLEDGRITTDEYKILENVFNDFINPISKNESTNNIVFTDKLFCLSGTFNSGAKDDIENKIKSKGGNCSKTITSKVDYLIVGGSGSEAWKFGNYGGKVQRAMELKEKGKAIEIIGEDEFIEYLN